MPNSKNPKDAEKRNIAALLKKANEKYPPTQPNGYQFDAARPVKDPRLQTLPTRKSSKQKSELAAAPVQGPPSIVELSRALDVDSNGPQLMFEWVYNNIEWEPGWGVYKGALGCLMDGKGNSFDQCLLLAALLRQAGYTANIIQGSIRLYEADYQAWWNVVDIWAAQAYCGNEFIPIFTIPTWDEDLEAFYMDINHVWIAWVDGETTYYFDPSYKQYTRTSPLSSVTLAAALDYDSTTYLSDAESGATVDGGGDYVQEMNRGNIRDNLTTYTTNLIDYINSNTIGDAPPGTATIDDILGGQSIIPAAIPILQTSLPYEMPGDDPNVWTGDVPDDYKPTLEIQMVNQDDPEIFDFDYTITSDELAATRLTIWYDEENIPSLYLNGDVVATGVAQDPFGWATWIVITVTHPAYDATMYPISWQQYYQTTWQWNQGPFIPGGPSYLIANAWGNVGTGQMRYHQKQLAANQAAGGSSTDEDILGEKLAIASWNWLAQNSRVCDLENRIRICHTMYNHQVGILSFNLWGDGAIAIDLGGVSGSSTNFNNDVTQTPPNDRVIAMHGVALEAGVCAQMTGLTPGISTTTVVDEACRTVRATIGGSATVSDVLTLIVHDSGLSGGVESVMYTVATGNTLSDIADGLAAAINSDTSLSAIGVTATSSGAQVALYTQSSNETTYTESTSGDATETITLAYDKIYRGTTTNWNTGTNVESILDGNGYDSGDMSDLYTSWIQWGNVAVLGDHPDQVLGAWTGWGDWVYPAGAFGFILGGIKGGGGQPGDLNNGPTDPNPGNDPGGQAQTCDPIGWFTGDYTYNREDMSLGSGSYPYRLSFKRTYNSARQYSNGPLGLGWSHNWQMSATVGSDGLLAMGSLSALQAVSTIAEFFVNDDLASDTTFSVAKLVTMCLADKWWIDQMVNNTVVVSTPENTRVFMKQSDGSYTLPVHNSSTLTIASGLYTLTDPKQVEYNFNSDGNLETIDYPNGVTVTLVYSTGKLQTVSNGMGRTLTLGYTGDNITSVSDGNGRSVLYDFDVDSNLETFTDAESKDTTYVYDQPGRMTQYFKPANPLTAYVTNVYDSLSRIQTQSNARSQTWTYYFSGSRAEEIDPLGNTHVRYLNQFGAITRDINALGFETDFEYDGLNRRILTTMPEGNQIQLEYDGNDNILTKTLIPKSGSGLSNIVLTWTYDGTFNKPLTFVDGNTNTWTRSYDAVTGDLISFVKPTVGGKVPKSQARYNNRGQVASMIDETGIQTQLTYDGTYEFMTSRIVNTNWFATISGTITISDVLTITAHDAALPGGLKSVNYTVTGGDTLALIATGLANAVNADTDLSTAGIVAYVSGAVVSLSTTPGNSTTFTSSTSGGATEIISLTSGLDLTWSFDYNDWGDADTIIDANSNETDLLFDNERRLIQKTDPTPFSYVTNLGYDDNGNLTSIQRQKNATPTWVTTSISYTVTGKKYQLTDPMTYLYQWDYDGKDRLQTYTDAESRAWNYGYDAMDRLNSTTDPTSTVSEARTFTDNGRLYELTDANTNTSTYSYDGLDRLDQTLYADSTYEQNQSYDDNNNVLIWQDRHGDSITNTFDTLNRISTKAPTGQATVTCSYDLAGRRIGVSTPTVGGNPASGSFLYFFDSAGRFFKETTSDSKDITYQIDAVGNITQLTYPDGYCYEAFKSAHFEANISAVKFA